MHPGRVALIMVQLGFFDGAKMIELDDRTVDERRIVCKLAISAGSISFALR